MARGLRLRVCTAPVGCSFSLSGGCAPAERTRPRASGARSLNLHMYLYRRPGYGGQSSHRVLDQPDEGLLGGGPVAGVAPHHGHGGVQLQRRADFLFAVQAFAVEHVYRDEEGDVAPFEEVDRGEAGVEAASVYEHDRSDGALGEFVPHEPEPVLTGGTEQVEHDLGIDGDAAEVQGDCGARFFLDPG